MCTLSPPEVYCADDLQPALRVADLADRRGGRIFVEQRAEAAQEVEVFRLALVVEVLLEVVGIDRRRGAEELRSSSGSAGLSSSPCEWK